MEKKITLDPIISCIFYYICYIYIYIFQYRRFWHDIDNITLNIIHSAFSSNYSSFANYQTAAHFLYKNINWILESKKGSFASSFFHYLSPASFIFYHSLLCPCFSVALPFVLSSTTPNNLRVVRFSTFREDYGERRVNQAARPTTPWSLCLEILIRSSWYGPRELNFRHELARYPSIAMTERSAKFSLAITFPNAN